MFVELLLGFLHTGQGLCSQVAPQGRTMVLCFQYFPHVATSPQMLWYNPPLLSLSGPCLLLVTLGLGGCLERGLGWPGQDFAPRLWPRASLAPLSPFLCSGRRYGTQCSSHLLQRTMTGCQCGAGTMLGHCVTADTFQAPQAVSARGHGKGLRWWLGRSLLSEVI